ncbi:MAG: arginine--tRNA ligase [Leuconostoc mesenteroides]|uniref:Arginine--tRNA ligase n=2 Tax=Leuconostoc mesenteroides TaxID=1245 RepID=SYR_LEUMM|nr:MULTISPECIES: arginine--tRNA ligase [Leuconostoc]Q03WV9.1 RecName: Full=Arginine--tRNA ligase; AltName: Full=Arginyl-tRNA synthetase; Short=ArgRS [Leuconostoc mesenteroides subsp. mesenteroides ATCC 8293]ABJ62313.1 arginyl-tRNA synthetase [Leuconostoc mesenteroides subsp. mesenteroides ATCC 8293]KAA8365893.1 arginine--tRNA ligase [Leuconostoc mesenteroides]KAA8377575.1 arginine--tRNA ligase [Leuconostoc mesenteroides]MBA5973077.1 arginine--tRNA ligase [Leuconostoc mesenteroides]MBZ1508965.
MVDNIQIVEALNAVLTDLTLQEISEKLEAPKSSDLGDVAFPTFTLAKTLHKAPQLIAADIVAAIDQEGFEKVVATGPYVNFFLDKVATSNQVLKTVFDLEGAYGDNVDGQGAKVTIDMSSPNIAKPMSMGHLRSTVIGNALANITAKNGYAPVKINHLGDWGTQFGKLIYAYKAWGSEEEVKSDPIATLLKYYVEFHEKAKENDSLNDEGRAWFKKLEDGDEEAHRLWQWFRAESLKEFSEIYDRLDITFDSFNGEAFYNDKMDKVVDLLEEKNLLVESQGAQIVDLSHINPNLTPAMIKRSDGATLYMTRDLAAALYRKETYDFAKSLYVVGGEQREHFVQMKAVLSLMGFEWSDDIEHIAFGLITFNGKKMSTRKGDVVLLKDVLDDAHELALKQIQEKNPDLGDKDTVAEEVGAGAVVFHDLMNDRTNNFDFNLEEVVRFEGDTGPYVQYTNARAKSILRKTSVQLTSDDLNLTDPATWDIITTLNNFPKTVQRAWQQREASIIAKYALNLSRAFNKYYANSKILTEDVQLNARLVLVKSVSIVLTESLRLLGVKAPEEM